MKLKSILVIFTFLIVICVSLSAVIASNNDLTVTDDGNNTLKNSNNIMTKESTLNTNKNVKNNGNNIMDDGEFNDIDTTFTQLAEDIKNSGGVLNLTHDYIYNSTKDSFQYKNGIRIRGLTINGNNHVISGSNSARLLDIDSETVTINNLIIANCSGIFGGAIHNLRVV